MCERSIVKCFHNTFLPPVKQFTAISSVNCKRAAGLLYLDIKPVNYDKTIFYFPGNHVSVHNPAFILFLEALSSTNNARVTCPDYGSIDELYMLVDALIVVCNGYSTYNSTKTLLFVGHSLGCSFMLQVIPQLLFRPNTVILLSPIYSPLRSYTGLKISDLICFDFLNNSKNAKQLESKLVVVAYSKTDKIVRARDSVDLIECFSSCTEVKTFAFKCHTHDEMSSIEVINSIIQRILRLK